MQELRGPNSSRVVQPGAIRIRHIDVEADDELDTLANTESSSVPALAPTPDAAITQEPIEATLVSPSDPDAQISRLTEAISNMQQQQQQMLEANNCNRVHDRSKFRDHFAMCISCLFCLQRRHNQLTCRNSEHACTL
jgi:hypothetical protein